MADVELLPCAECGMPCRAGEYHPFAACLMFQACHNSETVRANLAPLQAENERLRAEVERLNRIIGRIIEGDGDSTLTIRAGTDAFAAAREYLRAEASTAHSAVHYHIAEHAKTIARAERLAEALRLIAAPKRPDGTWNRDREACRQIAAEALADLAQEDRNG